MSQMISLWLILLIHKGCSWINLILNVLHLQGLMSGTLQGSLGCKKIVNGKGKLLLSAKKFELNCQRDKEMDVKASALADSVAELEEELCYESGNYD